LHGESDVEAIGWEDYLSQGAVLAVEWPERAGTLVPAGARRVVFRHLDGGERRSIEFI
jgi:tRNA A37 threonylcarbamoyladenosine biosynthesis protein TsaE